MAVSQNGDNFETLRFSSAGAEPGELVETKCRYCGGRGIDPFGCPGPNSVCQVCGGTGTFRVTAPFEDCAACGGTGRWPGRRLTCSSCAGRGVKTVTGPMRRCAACRGTGIQPGSSAHLPCVRCSGSGFVAMGVASSVPAAVMTPEADVEMEPGLYAETPTPLGATPRRRAHLAGFPSGGGAQTTVSASVEDRISAYVSTYPGANVTDVQALLGVSKEETGRTLKRMVRGQRLREKRGAYYPA
jgi:hypothetical protein